MHLLDYLEKRPHNIVSTYYFYKTIMKYDNVLY